MISTNENELNLEDRYLHFMARYVIVLLAFLALICGCKEQTSTSPVAQDSKQYTAQDVQDALNQAESLREQGKYEEALEQHLWYHKNALTYAPAQAGVRTSFALADWVELGKVYPKALQALRDVRDQTLVRFRKAPSDTLLYHEVMSINLALEDVDSARSLYYEGRKLGVYDDGGRLMLSLNEVLAKDKAWARDVVGSPDEKMGAIERMRTMMIESLKSQERPERFGNIVDESFVSQSVTLIRAVDMLLGRAEAEKVQKRALKTVNSPEIRDALKG